MNGTLTFGSFQDLNMNRDSLIWESRVNAAFNPSYLLYSTLADIYSAPLIQDPYHHSILETNFPTPNSINENFVENIRYDLANKKVCRKEDEAVLDINSISFKSIDDMEEGKELLIPRHWVYNRTTPGIPLYIHSKLYFVQEYSGKLPSISTGHTRSLRQIFCLDKIMDIAPTMQNLSSLLNLVTDINVNVMCSKNLLKRWLFQFVNHEEQSQIKTTIRAIMANINKIRDEKTYFNDLFASKPLSRQDFDDLYVSTTKHRNIPAPVPTFNYDFNYDIL